MNAVVKRIELPADRRVFALSDIHGNLDYLKSLLDKLAFSDEDILILLGDLVEKGPCSLDTLRYIMQLSQTHTVHALAGNCDRLLFEAPAQWLFDYRNAWQGNLLMNEFSRVLDFPVGTAEDIAPLRKRIREQFPEETKFLTGLPTVLESEHYIFVHGGIPGEDSLQHPESLTDWGCTKNDDFVRQGHCFRRWCIVGHWPTTLYRTDYPCANPLVSPAQHIVSIDGGCGVIQNGQLNALHLPPVPDGSFFWTVYDPLPTAVALDAQAASVDSINIYYWDNSLTILERGEEFCSCLHHSSGRKIDILTRNIVENEHGVFCEDSTDYQLPVQPGDTLSIIQNTSRGWLVKKDGVTGWYHGELTWRDTSCAAP